MKNQILFSLCAIFSSTLAISKRDEFDPSNYASEDVITRDVAVIGGGATGVYSAINLRAKNKSVVVVEKEAVLGGHVNSYTDPTTGISVDYGTQVFWNSTFSAYSYVPCDFSNRLAQSLYRFNFQPFFAAFSSTTTMLILHYNSFCSH